MKNQLPGHPVSRFESKCRRFTVELPEPVAVEIARIARAETKSFSAVLRDAAAAYVAELEEGAA